MDEHSLFFAALDHDTGQRSAFVDEACRSDVKLRRRVKRLLRLHEKAGSFLLEPATVPLTAPGEAPIAEGPGAELGPYKLLQEIGEGGMGLVFLAEQREPIRHDVAVKIIKPGMDTRQTIARFEAERQALALMDHPNISQVYDAGSTPSGRPYFVMELVRGVPITKYCDRRRLNTRQRLELFVQVCRAVQHAHQKGLIHRDLKPSNVLVASRNDEPTPKVIDFGVAKALHLPLSDKTVFTRPNQVLGTPLYMSPEQADPGCPDVDTRSDIYSLGVVLYELLTGATPFDRRRIREASPDEIRRIMREEEPPRPSRRVSTLQDDDLSTVSARRQTDPRRLKTLLRGELDWIAMKALRKNREERYDTADAFIADIQRYVRGEPVAAGPPSAAYRWRKFAGRHKSALLVSAALAAAVLAVAGSVGWMARDQAADRERAAALGARYLDQADQASSDGDFDGARLAVHRAEGVLTAEAADPQLQQRLERLAADLRLAERLKEIRL